MVSCWKTTRSLTQLLQSIVVSQVFIQMPRHVIAKLLHGVAPEAAGSPLTHHLEVIESFRRHRDIER